MRTRHALHAFALITLLYLAALVWADSRKQVFSGLALLWDALPPVLLAALLSYLIRFLRWHLLLRWSGHRVPVSANLLAYMAGFAFTATPGKVGELVRIRYLQDLQVPPSRTLAAFVFERLTDLLAVLALASLFIAKRDVFLFAAAFVVLVVVSVGTMAACPSGLTRLAARLRAMRIRALSKAVRMLRDGLRGCRIWLRPRFTATALLLGLLAWGVTSWAFMYLLDALGIAIPAYQAVSVYPIAMLAGAASMVPGGLGSTEAAIVALLIYRGISLDSALLSAVGIRLTSLWFSIFLGLVSVSVLEWRRSRSTPRPSRLPMPESPEACTARVDNPRR